MVKKYGIPLLLTGDDALKEYIQTVLSQVQGTSYPFPLHRPLYTPADESEWLMTSSITRLVLAIKSQETDETLERWQFDIQTDEAVIEALAAGTKPPPQAGGGGKKKEKTEKEVQGEIREIMKQITSTVTFLPILEDPCEYFQISRRGRGKRR
jgi:mitotic spindle assembly checkpoint protein MAD2